MSKAETKTIYFIEQPYGFEVYAGLQLVALEAKVTAKTVKVERCRATGHRSTLNTYEVFFSAADAIQAEEKRVVELEIGAAKARARLEALRLQVERT